MRKLIGLLMFLIPVSMNGQGIDVRIGQLGDTERNVTTLMNTRVQFGTDSSQVGVRVNTQHASDLFGNITRTNYVMDSRKIIGGVTVGQHLGIATTDSTDSRFLIGGFVEKNHKWNTKNPYTIKLSLDQNVIDVVARQIRTNVSTTGASLDMDVYLNNTVWVRSYFQATKFSDDNFRNILKLDVRKYSQSGVFYGSSGLYQTYSFDGFEEYRVTGNDVGRGYWAPTAYYSVEGQAGYKFPWNHTRFTGLGYLSAGIQQIDNNSPQNLMKVEGDFRYLLTKKFNVGIWGNLNNNAAVDGNVNGYRWWTLGMSAKYVL
jgi:hypothetical protein